MSYNKSIFQGVPKKNVNKSRFNLSHEYKAALTLGRLIPILTLETMPGDEFNIDTEFMFRFAPMYFPIMHKITMRADYYYIPNRILWPGDGLVPSENIGWAKWISNQEDSTGFGHPVVSSEQKHQTAALQNVMTYMGVPTGETDALNSTIVQLLNALPLSAYLKIWDEYYRVTQLEDERWFPLLPGINDTPFEAAFGITGTFLYIPLSAKWEKDYFTSALPTPQLGDAIQIPLITDDPNANPDLPTTWRTLLTGADPVTGALNWDSGLNRTATDAGANVGLDIQETAATIKQLRIAEVLQSYYERIMKVGQRYRDFIEGLWGNDPQPGDVDVPVLLGSKFGRVQISDVMTQALTLEATETMRDTGDYTGQANLYSNDGGNINYRCNEHGWLMCILQLNPNTSYGQGIDRFWRRQVQTDYPLDMFAGIGDQEILKEEVYHNFITLEAAKNDDTFGYIPRFSEMRYVSNKQIGVLNWDLGLSTHFGRKFVQAGATYDSEIEIQETFVNSAFETFSPGPIRITDIFRVLPINPHNPDTTEIVIFGHIFHSIYVNRALPMFSTPKSI